MGVKLQLLLGLLLIFSKCDCEKNTTSFENLALEKLDSTNNVIEKLPKTDTQINLVNKDTQDKYFGNDTHKNKTREELNNESDRTGRKDNSRSIDIEKFESHDLQTNDYGSPDSQKFLENSIRRTSTKGYIDFSKFQLTTPRHFFDSKFKEAKQKLEQEYDDNTPEHLDDEINDDDYDHRIHIDKLIGQSKTKPNSTVDYKEKTKISRNNTIGDGSEYNELKVEKMHKININSSYNFTTYDEDYTETTSPKEKIETTSPRGFIATTRKSVTLTKPPTSQSNHILSNKIEAETIKAINFLTTDYSTTKRLKEDNDLLSKEQTVEENKIIPLDKSTESSIEIIRNTTTEEINTSTEKTVNFDNATTTDQYEQTTVTFDQTTSTEYIETFKHDDNLETKNKIDSTTEYSTTVQDDIKTTTDSINTTDVPTTTIVTTTNDVIKQTTGYDYTTEQSTLQEITTEFVNRISKSFSFESTHTQEITEPISATVTTSMDDITVSTTDTTNFVETTTKKIVMPKILEPTTTVLTTTEFEITLTPEITEKINLSTLPNTLPISHSSSSSTSSVPVIINVTEDTTIHITTDDSFESSSGTDTGNLDNNEDNKGKIAAIIISSVGAVCLILLAGLLYIMRKRQRRFNYKQRCRPVGLDDYSVDNVSGYNSTRRKAERQSKRSYGNPAFDDPVAVTHPLNFPALAKFAINTDDIKAEFEEIPQITARANELPEGCETKNRYANVIPLPETRVFLQSIDTYPNSDYINANYVTGPTNIKGYYIACQGPMSNTVDDFWRMVWEQQTKVILMLTHLFENGVEKCVDYLPPSEVLDCNRLFGDFQVTLKKRDVKEKYIISNLQLKNMVSNSWREITHFWYLGWPERGVPSEENSIIAFLIEARSYMKSATLDKTEASNGNLNGSSKNEINPVLVHCSPGTGRTGVVLACDIAIREFEKNRLVDIPKIVYRIRRDRASAVQTKEQYMFIYKVVSLYATKLTGGALESL